MRATIKHNLPSETTVFSAKARALLQVIFLLMDMKWKNVVIFTDLLSVIRAIEGRPSGHSNYFISAIRKQLYLASSNGVEICVCWVPAHK